MSPEDAIPKVHIVVKRIAPNAGKPAYFEWVVTQKALDATGSRHLGYRGSGSIRDDMSGLKFDYGPAVLDEKRPVWTTMNPTDRPDIRKQLASLATKAAQKLKLSGDENFEHLIQ